MNDGIKGKKFELRPLCRVCEMQKKFTVELVNNITSPWIREKNIWFKGQVYNAENKLLTTEKLCEDFINFDKIETIGDYVANLKGLFSIIYVKNDKIFLVSDVTRTFPLFYTKKDEEWLVSDDANYLRDKLNLKFDKMLSKEFLFSGFMTANKTLVSDLYQIRAHEVLVLSDCVESKSYFAYTTNYTCKTTISALQNQLLEIYKRVGKRLVQSLNNRTAVLPLSGGYDSRLVLTLLKENNYKKIICFSYGKKLSYELRIATMVANRMGVELHTIEYSDNFLSKYLDQEQLKNHLVILSDSEES